MTQYEAREFHRKRIVAGWRKFRKVQNRCKAFSVGDSIILCDLLDMPVKTTLRVLADKNLIFKATKSEYKYMMTDFILDEVKQQYGTFKNYLATDEAIERRKELELLLTELGL